jgi:hypothetical protein
MVVWCGELITVSLCQTAKQALLHTQLLLTAIARMLIQTNGGQCVVEQQLILSWTALTNRMKNEAVDGLPLSQTTFAPILQLISP